MLADIPQEVTKTWLVDGWLGAGEFSALYGEPGAGKSVLAEDIGLRVAAGLEWHGCRTKQGAVLYLAVERASLVERRGIAFCQRHALDRGHLPFGVVSTTVNFTQPATAGLVAGTMAALIARTGIEGALIVLDTVSAALDGGDENSPKDIGKFVSTARRVQELSRCHVMVVHHSPLDGRARLRGHGSLLAALDTAVHVERRSTTSVAKITKANDGPEQSFAFALESVDIGPDTTSPIVVPAVETLRTEEQPRRSTRRLSPKYDLARDRLATCITKAGRSAPSDWNLPASQVVDVSTWREELLATGVIERDGKNPRTDFKRIKAELTKRGLIGERNGVVWLTGKTYSQRAA